MKKLFIFSIFVLLISGCKKESEGTPATANMEEYYPLQIGKYITYKLDSTVYINLNTQKVVHSYVVRDYVDSKFQDNTGQDVYRIRRMMRDQLDTTMWKDNATFLVTQNKKSTDFTENNLRYIKLINPVKEFATWQGNNYIDVKDDFLSFYEGWEYFYEKVGEPFTAGTQTFDETITVNQVDNVDNDPGNPNLRYEITRASEVYARGVGLIYKDFFHELWQPILKAYEPNSYGVKLTILNHN